MYNAWVNTYNDNVHVYVRVQCATHAQGICTLCKYNVLSHSTCGSKDRKDKQLTKYLYV